MISLIKKAVEGIDSPDDFVAVAFGFVLTCLGVFMLVFALKLLFAGECHG